jgi:hypothetical protein
VQQATSRSVVVWMIAIAGATISWQIVRLQQTGWLWYPFDYAGRIVILGMLATHPVLHKVVFQRERLKVSLAIVIDRGLFLIPVLWVTRVITDVTAVFLPDTQLGFYPAINGPFYLFDVTFGIALSAIHEELCFRRAIPLALAGLGHGAANTLASAILFGAFHWWTGIPNMINAAAFGVIALAFYRGAGALWPVMVIHYVVDFVAFT